MKIIRMLAAGLVLQNVLPAPAMAAIAQVTAPTHAAPALTVATIPPTSWGVRPAALGRASLAPLTPQTLKVLSIPSLNAVVLPTPLPVAPTAAAPASLPLAAPRQASTRAQSIVFAQTAARAAAETLAKPSGLETDRAAVDFVDTPSKREAQEVPAGGAELRVQSTDSLQPPSHRAISDRQAPPAPRLLALQSGTFGAQVASNSLQVTMPLLLLHLSGSAAVTAFAATLSSALDAAGTVLGGWLVDRLGSRPVLLGTTLARGAALLALPLLALSGGLSVPLVLAAYLAESLARGVADTARNTIPSEMAGPDGGLLKHILAKNQVWFEAGGVTGPLLSGLLIANAGGAAAASALWLAPMVFAAVALAYLGLPSRPAARIPGPVSPLRSGFDGWTKWALAGTALLTLYPLKGLLPAIFAGQILRDPASAAWLVGLFGAGGLLGSLLYGRLSNRVGLRTWLTLGAAGTAALAAAFLPGAFLPAAVGILAFSALNGAARLSLNAAIQARARGGKTGAAVGASRFTANLSSLGVRFLSSLAFTTALAPTAAFWLMAAGMVLVAVGQAVTARRLTPVPAAPAAMVAVSPVAAGASVPLIGRGLLLAPEQPAAGPNDFAVASIRGALSTKKRHDGRLSRIGHFDKDPGGDADNIRRNYLHEKRGEHFYFRNMLLPMQERFAQLMDMAGMPRVFLHGSPHLDNYAKSRQGGAMVDFDRARIGPYAWDLVRLMVSVSLRRKKDHGDLLAPEVLKQLKKGYLHGFRHPDRPFSEARLVKDAEPKDDETSTNAYLKADKKWAHEMRQRPLARDDPDVVALVRSWAKGRKDGILKKYFIEEAGRGQGSMGLRDLYLVVLAPKDRKSGRDRILLNIKATRTDPDTKWYKNPYPTEAERMAEAAELYAPGWELLGGGASLYGVEYYVHQVDPQNAKIKKMLNREQQEDFAYATGTQLGRAHRLSLQEAAPERLEEHLAANFDRLVAAGRAIRDEIVAAHARYLKQMRHRGLEPASEGESE